MRIRPEPGVYTLTIEGHPFVVTVTETGMTYEWNFLEFEWVWEDIEGGPVLVPSGVAPPVIAGFTPPDAVAVTTSRGTYAGTYTPVP